MCLQRTHLHTQVSKSAFTRQSRFGLIKTAHPQLGALFALVDMSFNAIDYIGRRKHLS